MSDPWRGRLRSKRPREEEGAWVSRLRPRSQPAPISTRAKRSRALSASPVRSKKARQEPARQAERAVVRREEARRAEATRAAEAKRAAKRAAEAEAMRKEAMRQEAKRKEAKRKEAKRKAEAAAKKAVAAAMKAEAEAKAERRAAVLARMAGLLRLLGARKAFQAHQVRVQQALAEYERRLQMRARARRLFGALVRRRMAKLARMQQLLRRLGGRHSWRLGAMAALHQRKMERRFRRALRRLSRFVHSAGARSASITVQPFAFMRSKGSDGYVTELRQGYRGHAFTQDSKGRYHQQLKELTVTVPLAATFALREHVVLWCVDSAQPVDKKPAFDAKLPIFSHVVDALQAIDSCITAVRFKDVIEVDLDAAYDALAVVNHASARAAFVYSKHASADTRAGAGTLDTWLVRPAAAGVRLANACAYDLLLQLYQAPIQALQRPDPSRKDHRGGRYRELDMSYRGLWRFFHGDAPFDAGRLGLTLPQFRTFFEHLGLELTVVDCTGASILDACHTPQRANRKLNPRHVWVAHHDEHLFHLNSGLKSLSQLPRSLLSAPIDALTEVEQEEGPPSAHFYIPRTSAPVTFIERLDDLTTLDLSGPAAVVRVACPVDMSVALYELVTRCSYLPGITMRAGAIAALRLRLHEKDIYLSPPDCVPNDRTVMIECREEFVLYRAMDALLAGALMKREGMSSYSKDVGRCFRELPRSPLSFGTGADADKFGASFGAGYSAAAECSVHDLSKAHTAALLAMTHFPVFNEFDRFKPFTGAVTPHALYTVRRATPYALTDPRFLLLDEEVSVVTAQAVLLCQDWPGVRIEGVLEPSKLVSAKEAHDAIRAIWGSELAVEHKKFLVNKAVGMLGRRYNTKERSHLFRGQAEAAHCSRRLRAQLLARRIGGEVFYIVHKEERAELVDGFYPTQHLVYDWVRIQLYLRVVAVGRPHRAVKTDALVFAGLEPAVEKEHTFAGIGRWGVSSELKRLPSGAPSRRKSTFVPAATASVAITAVRVADEFDGAEVGALLDANNFLLLLGDLPGVGKTEAPKRHCPKATTLFVVPANKLKADIAKQGHAAVTLHALLGVRVDGEGVAPMDISRYTTVVFDEVFSHPVAMLARIGAFMRRNATAGAAPRKFYAAGDAKQNPPIERLCVSNAMAYYMDAVSTLFPTQLTLRICKRAAGQQARLEEIREDLFTRRTSPSAVLLKHARHVRDVKDVQGTAICYLNSTASAINNLLHDRATAGRADLMRVGDKSYYKGLELVCRKRLEAHFANERGEYKRRGVLQVNFTYAVLEACEAALVLDDLEGGRVRVTHAQALRCFSYSHAFTGHAQQGMSVDGAVTIFDHGVTWLGSDGVECGVNAQWVYTALSRARHLGKVHVFVGALGGAVREREFELAMERKIYSYQAADRVAGRAWRQEDYVSAADIKDMLGAQRWRCAGCGCALQQRWEKGDHEQVTVDRRDNAKAHVRDNCQLLCLKCNKRKQ